MTAFWETGEQEVFRTNREAAFPGNPELIMTWRNWLTYQFNPWDIIINASAIDGSDSPQQHPIGVSVFLADGLPKVPAAFLPKPQHNWERYLVNAIFRTATTRRRDNIRLTALEQLPDDIAYKKCSTDESRLPAETTTVWYQHTPFTASPRGHGMDCHRTYEALLFKSIPIVLGYDEALLDKYQHLPVVFVDDYSVVTREWCHTTYRTLLNRTYNFNYLSRRYWKTRRPDVNMLLQSVYWLKRFNKWDRLQGYFDRDERAYAETIRPSPYRTAGK